MPEWGQPLDSSSHRIMPTNRGSMLCSRHRASRLEYRDISQCSSSPCLALSLAPHAKRLPQGSSPGCVISMNFLGELMWLARRRAAVELWRKQKEEEQEEPSSVATHLPNERNRSPITRRRRAGARPPELRAVLRAACCSSTSIPAPLPRSASSSEHVVLLELRLPPLEHNLRRLPHLRRRRRLVHHRRHHLAPGLGNRLQRTHTHTREEHRASASTPQTQNTDARPSVSRE